MKKNLVQFFLLLVFLLGSSFSVEASQDQEKKDFVVVLDAGHGGKDPGKSTNGYLEKDIALSIILKVGKQLENMEDIKVIYTRKTDVFIPLHKRAEIANSANADLFVSIHCNAASSKQAYGSETFVLGLHRNRDNLEIAMKENSVIYLEEDYDVKYDGFDPNDPTSYMGMTLMQEEYLDQSILLADFVQKQFTNVLKRRDRGVKQAGFLVLRETYMPSVLIETGFLTNNNEGRYLNSKTGQEKMADAILKGILNYKNNLNLNTFQANTTPKKSEIYEDVTFKVQIAAGSSPLETAPYNFKGLTGVTREKEGKLYKYYVGETSDYMVIQEKQRLAKEKGYSGCYIVAFRKGKKISVNEALKTKAK